MMLPIARITNITSLLAFVIGLPTAIATYYQAFKTRQEARQARELVFSQNCLEYVDYEGNCINLIPLETLHTLPKPGDIVLLPGDGLRPGGMFQTAAYRVDRIEHLYTRVDRRSVRPQEARLTKAVAHVTSLHTAEDESHLLDSSIRT